MNPADCHISLDGLGPPIFQASRLLWSSISSQASQVTHSSQVTHVQGMKKTAAAQHPPIPSVGHTKFAESGVVYLRIYIIYSVPRLLLLECLTMTQEINHVDLVNDVEVLQ